MKFMPIFFLSQNFSVHPWRPKSGMVTILDNKFQLEF